MVDMPHDGHDRRTNNKRLGIILDLRNLRRICFRRQFFASDAKLNSNERRCFIVNFLIDCRHNAHKHELLDDFRRRIAHLAREILDGNALTNLDMRRMCDFHLGCLLLLSLIATAATVLVTKFASIIGIAAIVPIAGIIGIPRICAAVAIATLRIATIALTGIRTTLVWRRSPCCVGTGRSRCTLPASLLRGASLARTIRRY